MEEELEELPGWTGIKKRMLTNEEKDMPLTAERIRTYEIHVGESFLDQHGSEINLLAVMGFLMALHPHKAKELLEMGNSEYGDLNSLDDIFLPDGWNEKDYSNMLQDVCDFINLTVETKSRLNTILICIDEHYKKSDK